MASEDYVKSSVSIADMDGLEIAVFTLKDRPPNTVWIAEYHWEYDANHFISASKSLQVGIDAIAQHIADNNGGEYFTLMERSLRD